MKSLYRCATGKHRPKYDAAMPVARLWATMRPDGSKRIIQRSDGSISVDKSAGTNARRQAKQTLRQANRAINKRARQLLKFALIHELQEQ